MPAQYGINAKIPSYVRRLEIMYRHNDQKIFHEIICRASIFIQFASCLSYQPAYNFFILLFIFR